MPPATRPSTLPTTWPRTRRPWCPSLLTALTWLRVIFFLFPRLKRDLKGKHWDSVENFQAHVTRFLRGIPVEEFQGAFQAWQNHLRKVIDTGGDYFEIFEPMRITFIMHRVYGNSEYVNKRAKWLRILNVKDEDLQVRRCILPKKRPELITSCPLRIFRVVGVGAVDLHNSSSDVVNIFSLHSR